jgi:hypothetical protein
MSCCTTPFASEIDPSASAFYGLFAPFMADGTKELVRYNLPQNQPLVTIPMSVQKLSNNLGITGPVFYNTVDSTPMVGLTFEPTNFATSSITGLVNFNAPTSNYWVEFVVFVAGT